MPSISPVAELTWKAPAGELCMSSVWSSILREVSAYAAAKLATQPDPALSQPMRGRYTSVAVPEPSATGEPAVTVPPTASAARLTTVAAGFVDGPSATQTAQKPVALGATSGALPTAPAPPEDVKSSTSSISVPSLPTTAARTAPLPSAPRCQTIPRRSAAEATLG